MKIQTLIHDFVTKLDAFIATEARRRVLDAFGAAFSKKRTAIGTIRHVHPGGFVTVEVGNRPRHPVAARRKGPIQLCPVPSCMLRAAPVFGMVCSGHKDVPKAKIRAYREARRAAKAAA